jgi:hypothetical protein
MPLSQIDYIRKLQNLPALTAVESAIALAWLNLHWRDYETVNFNVRLGEGVKLPPGSPDYMAKFVRASTAKRADMILTAGNVATIVEVKIRIGASALGQLLTYQTLLTAEQPDFAAVHMIAAGATIEPDIRAILESHGITVEVFPSVAVP